MEWNDQLTIIIIRYSVDPLVSALGRLMLGDFSLPPPPNYCQPAQGLTKRRERVNQTPEAITYYQHRRLEMPVPMGKRGPPLTYGHVLDYCIPWITQVSQMQQNHDPSLLIRWSPSKVLFYIRVLTQEHGL